MRAPVQLAKTYNNNYYYIIIVDCRSAVASVRDSHTVRFPFDWLLHCGSNRGSHSANHNLGPDMIKVTQGQLKCAVGLQLCRKHFCHNNLYS